MKNLNKLIVFVLLAGISGTVSAQNFKFGHINAQELIMLMPERDSAIVKWENYVKEVQEQIETMQVEFNNKMTVYQSKQATWSAIILEQKQKELQELTQRIEEFERTAQQDAQNMQRMLLSPVSEKAINAVKKVGKDNGFTYIFDISSGVLPYFNEDQSVDILPLVKKELGIPADKKLPTQSAAR